MKNVVGRWVERVAAAGSDPRLRRFTAALLVIDLVLVALHIVNLRWLRHETLSLETDRGLGEFYQHLKLAAACGLIVRQSRRGASSRYLAWLPLYVYFLLDDVLGIHERGGELVAALLRRWSSPDGFDQWHGELAVSAGAGVCLLLGPWRAYRSGSGEFRRFSRALALLTLVLVFFGVVVDALHALVQDDALFDALLGAVEEGGELATTSLIVAYLALAPNCGAPPARGRPEA